ncbi:MBL fold metallo-hydrolase [Aquabacterium sp.]|uniref:MBL fold metallo-hydrolase n=1 Tax=Aquabacterium sp. TaxID=1872578 RepID=UPI002CFBF530|nr:MBL fold metallo-hydrolase [Aquabacterium sp.]HSW06995.1 MBL fold metallo-hydrolase [Aquabacterium sp.]
MSACASPHDGPPSAALHEGPDGAPLRVVPVANGVYLVGGAAGLADPQNLGRIGNTGFIVGKSGVLAIDTGTSHAHGLALLRAIRQVTDKPVRLALVTHTRPEFLFGGAAFREAGIPIGMHEKTARLMAARCDTCLKQLRQTLGDAAMQGTTMYKPDREFAASHAVDGTVDAAVGAIGRAVRVLYFGHSSGPGDIAVFDESSGVLFGGGLLDHGRIPDIQDANLDGWKRALAELRALRVNTLVPGHGTATSSPLITTVERYLVQLETRARALAEAGTSLMDVPEATALPEFSRWEQYDTIHPRNATIAYLRFERELFFK